MINSPYTATAIKTILLTLLFCAFTVSCTRQKTGGSLESDYGVNRPQSQLYLSIIPFAPVEISRSNIEKMTVIANRIEATLFTIKLRQVLAAANDWGSVTIVSTIDQPGDMIVSGHIILSDADVLQISVSLISTPQTLQFGNVYKSSSPDGPEARFVEIADRIDADLSDLSENSIFPEVENAGSSYTNGHIIDATGKIFTETIDSYQDIYFEDMIQPFSEYKRSRPDSKNSLPELEEQLINDQLKGAAAVAEALLWQCMPNVPETGHEPLFILNDERFSRYSNLEVLQDYSEKLRQTRELGLVVGNGSSNYTLVSGNKSYLLIGPPEEQYSKWRQMIADSCIKARRKQSILIREIDTPQPFDANDR